MEAGLSYRLGPGIKATRNEKVFWCSVLLAVIVAAITAVSTQNSFAQTNKSGLVEPQMVQKRPTHNSGTARRQKQIEEDRRRRDESEDRRSRQDNSGIDAPARQRRLNKYDSLKPKPSLDPLAEAQQKWDWDQRIASSHESLLIAPANSLEASAIFSRALTTPEMNSIRRVKQDMTDSSVDSLTRFRDRIENGERKIISIIGHNENGILKFGNGENIALKEAASYCARAGKICIFLSCNAKAFVPEAVIAMGRELTYREAHVIERALSARLSSSRTTSLHEISKHFGEIANSKVASGAPGIKFDLKVIYGPSDEQEITDKSRRTSLVVVRIAPLT